MSRFLPDTNVMIAMIRPWQDLPAAANAEWQRRIRANEQPVLAAHCWSEAYSVLTRLPPAHRSPPAETWDALELVWKRPTVALDAGEWLATLAACARDGIGGGRIYDELIAACARKAKVDTLLTFNPRHFERHAGWFAICVPGRSY